MDAAGCIHINIHFAAHAEFRQIDSRLDRKTSSRQDPPRFVRLEVVHIRAVAMIFLADRMARAVDEIVAIPGFLDHVAGRPVHLPALELLAGLERGADALNRGVPSRDDNVEHLDVLGRRRFTDERDAGQIAVNGSRLGELSPQVHQHEIALANLGVAAGLRLIMRVAAVRADADDGRMIGGQPVALEMVENVLLDFGFADRAAAASSFADELPSGVVC